MESLMLLKKVVAEVKATYDTRNEIQSAKISSSSNTSTYLRSIYPTDIQTREAFLCLYLNRANNVQGFAVVSIGGLSSTTADPKIIFQHALLCNASSIILAHNHPSGSLTPSQQDINLTQKAKQAGKLLDLPVLDHIILTAESYYSFADECLL